MNEFGSEVWQTIKKQEVFVAAPWIKVSVEQVRLPNGMVVDNYHQIALPDYAVIVAQTADGRVIMERQYKHGVGKVSLMLPGGTIEDNEDPLVAAKRELLEETGYLSDDWQSLGCFIANANYGCGKAHVFVARNVQQVAEPNSGDLEDMEIVLIQPEEVGDALRKGEVIVLGAVMAIALALNPMFTPSKKLI
ncbi:MAG TPA: NUDIX hydrolase [Candidatus Obscuribacterales bacterium]